MPNLSYIEKPKKILDRSVKELRNKSIPMVKVLWEIIVFKMLHGKSRNG
jgi:hypothetical protein